MACIVDKLASKSYRVEVSPPDSNWIDTIASQLGMLKAVVVAAALNKGLVYYVDMLREIKQHEADESHAESHTPEVTGEDIHKLFHTDTQGDRNED